MTKLIVTPCLAMTLASIACIANGQVILKRTDPNAPPPVRYSYLIASRGHTAAQPVTNPYDLTDWCDARGGSLRGIHKRYLGTGPGATEIHYDICSMPKPVTAWDRPPPARVLNKTPYLCETKNVDYECWKEFEGKGLLTGI